MGLVCLQELKAKVTNVQALLEASKADKQELMELLRRSESPADALGTPDSWMWICFCGFAVMSV